MIYRVPLITKVKYRIIPGINFGNHIAWHTAEKFAPSNISSYVLKFMSRPAQINIHSYNFKHDLVMYIPTEYHPSVLKVLKNET